ncbi:MAG: efflux RND transporter periplasmic adaptor subunit [Acidobacteriaceae bacterium]|nr:efflux RND transporter periplasmic adaptor subunit [Acidobacteriaceae bacterium]MBV9781651.1 efflux RND transporter periplasmic adaptor subunit [Acidobacteriaceae bacterium]
MKKARSKAVLRIAAGVLVVAACALGILRGRQTRAKADIPTAQAKRGEFLVTVHCRGNLVATESIQLSAPVDVQDLQIVWLAPNGSEVKAGQVVVRFDPSRSEQELREKKVALAQAQASLDQAVADARITSDQDELDLASAELDRDKARLEASKKSIVSAMEGEKSAIDLGLAEQKVKLQQATMQLHKASADAKIASQERLRDAAKAEYDRAERRLAQLNLVSPHDGVVEYRTNRTAGWTNAQPFKVGDHVSAGVTIAELSELSSLEMESKVDEVDRGRIAAGDDVVVHVDAFPEKNFPGKMASISPLTEQDFVEWPPTRTFRAFSVLNQREPGLRPGMNGSADIIQSRLADAIHIPLKALFTDRGQAVVYLKASDGYKREPVRLLARNSDEVAVSGLKTGDTVALTNPELNR